MQRFAIVFASAVMFAQNSADEKDASPHMENFVQANGVRLHYLDWGGDGEPLVLLTGYGATAHVFDSLAPRLTKTFRVVAVTRRGRAPSERSSSGYDLATLTSDVRAFLDALKLRRIHLVGHSFAGSEMTEFASLHPERVISLVYFDAALDAAAGEALMAQAPVPVPKPPPGSPFAQVREWWTSYSPDFSRLKSPALAIYGVQDRSPSMPKNASDELRQRIDDYWRTKWTPMIRRTAEKFRREVPNSQVVVLENAGHYFFRDREEEVVRHMERFFAFTKSRN
jgi:pimeloyl-ACP methyl ester carboxylesterase